MQPDEKRNSMKTSRSNTIEYVNGRDFHHPDDYEEQRNFKKSREEDFLKDLPENSFDAKENLLNLLDMSKWNSKVADQLVAGKEIKNEISNLRDIGNDERSSTDDKSDYWQKREVRSDNLRDQESSFETSLLELKRRNTNILNGNRLVGEGGNEDARQIAVGDHEFGQDARYEEKFGDDGINNLKEFVLSQEGNDENLNISKPEGEERLARFNSRRVHKHALKSNSMNERKKLKSEKSLKEHQTLARIKRHVIRQMRSMTDDKHSLLEKKLP